MITSEHLQALDEAKYGERESIVRYLRGICALPGFETGKVGDTLVRSLAIAIEGGDHCLRPDDDPFRAALTEMCQADEARGE